MATTSGPMRDGDAGQLTLDDIATGHFRGYLAENSISLYPELDDCFYNSRFLELAREYWGARVREADAHVVQPVWPAPQRSEPAPRRGHLPRGADRELAGVAPERDGEVRALHRPSREDGAGHHVVVPGRERDVHLLARRTAGRAPASRAPALEQGRGRAERGDVPSRRSGRPSRRARPSRAQAPFAAGVRLRA